MYKPKRTSIGIPPKPEELYIKLYQFIDSVIDGFSFNGISDEEDDITLAMSYYLDSRSEESSDVFKFINQANKTDIGVFVGRHYKSNNVRKLCWIEAKRLPTPKVTNRDEREYVFVDHTKLNRNGNRQFDNNGGIERFKMSKHAAGYPVAMMFGYVQDGTFAFWERKINEWLEIYSTTLPFSNKEQLERVDNQENRYISIHQRIDKDNQPAGEIKLYHFWLNV